MSEAPSFSVLVIDDSGDDAELVRRHLGPEFAIQVAADAGEVAALLERGGWDLAVLDWNVPGLDTGELMRTLSERPESVPCIVVTGAVPLAEAVSAMQLGARDCFQKDGLLGLRAAAHREVDSHRRQRELLVLNQRLVETTQEHSRLLEALHEIALGASGQLSVERLSQLAAEGGRQLLGAPVEGIVALLESSGESLAVVHDSGGRVGAAARQSPIGGANQMALRGRQPVIVNDYPAWPHALGSMVGRGFASVLIVPMLNKGGEIGTLGFYTTSPHQFGQREAEVATMLASQLSPAIAAARSHEQLQQRSATQEVVAELGRAAVLGAADLQLGQMAVSGLAELLHAEASAVLAWGPTGLLPVVASNWPHSGSPLSASPGPPGTIATVVGEGVPPGCCCAAVHIEHEGLPAILALRRSGRGDLQPVELHTLGAIASVLTEASRAAAAERALRASEKRYRAIFEWAAEGVWQVDRDGRTVSANQRMAAILRAKPGELEQSTIWDFTEPGEVGAHRRRLKARLGGSSGRYEQGLKATDGMLVRASIAASPIREENGEVTGVVLLVTDLSERLAAEQAIRESQEKSRFLAGMSHELRTPLNSILGFSELLEDSAFGKLSARQRRYVGHIRSQGRHLLDLISDVLDLSKVSAGKLEFAREAVDMADIASDVAARLRPLADGKAQRLVMVVDSVAVASADRLRVTQAVMNLVSNAVKYTPEGGRIEIRVSADAGSCAIAVVDDGPGIAPDDQAIVFDEFSKLSSGRRGEGTGLGLSLTRRLVEAMGGHVSLTSKVGGGSTFRIVLPAA